MNLQAIMVANLTGFILIAILFVNRKLTISKSDTEEHAFTAIMYLSMVACLLEALTFAVDGIPNKYSYWIIILGNTYLYYANGVGSFLFLLYVDLKLYHDRSRMKKLYYKLSLPVSILLLSLVGNIFFHYYFYVDENYVYHRQPTVYIFYLYLTLTMAYSLFLCFKYKKTHGGIPFFPIHAYLVPIIIGSILQMLFYGVSLAWLGTAIGIVGLHMSLQQQKTYLDALTGLYNRHYLAHSIYIMTRNSSPSYYGLMIDMNDFKLINDTYGHSVGDKALELSAQIFSSTIKKLDAKAFRYAGDEFIIIVNTDDEKTILKLEDDLREATKKFNEEHILPCSISFSIGHAKYDADDSDSFLKKIDFAMYEDKRRYHEG